MIEYMSFRVVGAVIALSGLPTLAWAQQDVSSLGGGGSAVIRGTVVGGETHEGLAGVAVALFSERGGTAVASTITRGDGDFVLRPIPSGDYRIELTHIAYRAVEATMRIEGSSDVDISVQMLATAIEIEPIVVTARRRSPAEEGGFDQRRRSGRGVFMAREEIEVRQPAVVTDVLRVVPGLLMTPSSHGWGYDVRMRGGCRPELWLDGIRTLTSVGIDSYLNARDVEAVEVYRGTELPTQYGSNPCGAIVVWTRVPQPVPGDGPIWMHVAIGGGFLSLALALIY